MSGGGGSSISTSSTSVPQYVQDQHYQNLQAANAVTGRDYQPYTGQRVADFSQDQQNAFTGIRNAASAGSNAFAQGVGTMTGLASYTPSQIAAGQLANTDLSAYLNPYTSQVIDTTINDLGKANAKALSQLGSQAALGGAYGGSRMGIAQAEQNRNFTDQVASTAANLRNTGYQTAQQAAQQDIANRLAADQFNVNSGLQGAQFRLGAANQLANAGLTAQNALYDAGAKQQALNQTNLDTAYSDFQNQWNYPVQMLQLRNSFLNPQAVGSTTTTSTPNAGLLQQGLGAGMTAAAIYSMLK